MPTPFSSLVLGSAPLLNAAGSAVEVDINPSLVLMQLGVVTVLMFVLKPLLFDPLLKLFEARENLVEGTLRKARELDEKAANLKLKVDGKINDAKKVAAEERDKVKAEAQRQDAAELARTRAEVASILDEGRRNLALESAALDAALRGDVTATSRDVASRVLGREVA